MTEFIFITASDIHISDYGPRSRIDDYKSSILDKIRQMGIACSKLKADAALLAGDIFNLKDPFKNSHELNRDLIKEFKKFPCPIYAIEGNHDIKANRLDSIKGQPLGVLFEDRTLLKLRNEILEKGGFKVSLIGIPYTEDLKIENFKIPKKDCIAQICVLHQYAGIKPGMLFKERLYGYEELAVLESDVFVIGHYHIDQGIYEYQGKHFINIGSISRGTLSDEDINHHPQIGLIRISVDENGNPNFTVRSIKLNVKPASEVFDVDKRKEEQKENEAIKEFVEKLANEMVNKNIDTAKSIEEVIDAMGVAKVIKDRAMRFIQEATVNR